MLALPTSCFFSSSQCLRELEAGREPFWRLDCLHNHLQGTSFFFTLKTRTWWIGTRVKNADGAVSLSLSLALLPGLSFRTIATF